MAGSSKQFDFAFDGGLQSHTRASLINEVIKQLLYQRNQIPLQFDTLKQQMAVDEEKRSQVVNKRLSIQHQIHKTKSVISNLDQVFTSILRAFETCPEIQQALVMLGSTPITPKESYTIHLPHICPEADNISLKSSKQALFRHLIAEQVLSGDAPLGPTNVYVMLSAPRSAMPQGFLPKINFKVPTKGYCLTLNISCNQPNFSAQDLTMDDSEVEISGVEPLERSSVCDVVLPEVGDHLGSPSPMKMVRMIDSVDRCQGMRVRHASSTEVWDGQEGEKIQFNTPLTRSTPKVHYNGLLACDRLNIWFQCATMIKGYKM